MEQDVKLGTAGDLDIKLVAGKASLTLTLPAAETSVTVATDASALVAKLFAAIEAASPAGAQPIEEGVKAVVLAAVAAL